MKPGIVPVLFVASASVAGAILFGACKKPVAEEAPTPSAPVPASVASTTATPALEAISRTLAPPGIFFLLKQESIVTDDGVVGLKPGQPVREVSPGTYEYEGKTIRLTNGQVTNDLLLAQKLAAADATAQAALRQMLTAHHVAKAAPATPIPARVSATPAPQPVQAPVLQAPALGGLSGANVLNHKRIYTDSHGRQFWRDANGNIRYD